MGCMYLLELWFSLGICPGAKYIWNLEKIVQMDLLVKQNRDIDVDSEHMDHKEDNGRDTLRDWD